MDDQAAIKVLKSSTLCRIGLSYEDCEKHCALAHECTQYAAMTKAIQALDERCICYKVCSMRKQEEVIQAFADCED